MIFRSDYDPRLQRVSGAEHRAVRKEIDSWMTEAIRDAPLTIQPYNEIPDLVERYDSLKHLVRQNLEENWRNTRPVHRP